MIKIIVGAYYDMGNGNFPIKKVTEILFGGMVKVDLYTRSGRYSGIDYWWISAFRKHIKQRVKPKRV